MNAPIRTPVEPLSRSAAPGSEPPEWLAGASVGALVRDYFVSWEQYGYGCRDNDNAHEAELYHFMEGLCLKAMPKNLDDCVDLLRIARHVIEHQYGPDGWTAAVLQLLDLVDGHLRLYRAGAAMHKIGVVQVEPSGPDAGASALLDAARMLLERLIPREITEARALLARIAAVARDAERVIASKKAA